MKNIIDFNGKKVAMLDVNWRCIVRLPMDQPKTHNDMSRKGYWNFAINANEDDLQDMEIAIGKEIFVNGHLYVVNGTTPSDFSTPHFSEKIGCIILSCNRLVYHQQLNVEEKQVIKTKHRP